MTKNNQPTLATAIEGLFETDQWVDDPEVSHNKAELLGKNHGSLERCNLRGEPYVGTRVGLARR